MAKRKFKNGGVVLGHARYMFRIICHYAAVLATFWLNNRTWGHVYLSQERCSRERAGNPRILRLMQSADARMLEIAGTIRNLASLGRQNPAVGDMAMPWHAINAFRLMRAQRARRYHRQALDDANSRSSSEDSDGERRAFARRRARLTGPPGIPLDSEEDYDSSEVFDESVLFYEGDPKGPDRGPDGGAPPPAVSA